MTGSDYAEEESIGSGSSNVGSTESEYMEVDAGKSSGLSVKSEPMAGPSESGPDPAVRVVNVLPVHAVESSTFASAGAVPWAIRSRKSDKDKSTVTTPLESS